MSSLGADEEGTMGSEGAMQGALVAIAATILIANILSLTCFRFLSCDSSSVLPLKVSGIGLYKPLYKETHIRFMTYIGFFPHVDDEGDTSNLGKGKKRSEKEDNYEDNEDDEELKEGKLRFRGMFILVN
jgi:hypothetical protein